MTQDTLQTLHQAVVDLTYPSESDEPFEPFQWDASGSALEQIAAHSESKRVIQTVSLEDFFSQLDQTDDAARYRQLQRLVSTSLSSPQIFRVGEGEVRVDIYLLGKSPDGRWTGLHTVSVET